MNPQLWIIAGPNGSGKTTLVQRYIGRFAHQVPVVNPDEIAATINPSAPGSAAMQAGRKALKLQNQYLNAEKSFLLETTFSGKRELKLLQKAKEKGFKINLIFVGLDNTTDNIERVKRRVLDGGHDVPITDIIRRYYRSMANLSSGLVLVDRAFVFDNQGKKHQLIAVFELGNIVRQADYFPTWFENNVKISKKFALNLATVGLVRIKKDILTSPDFLAGKTGNPAAADRVVDQVWSDKKTEQLREHLTGNKFIFLTMPSTTRLNVIPVQLAQFLSRQTGHPWALGDEIYKTKHKTASKEISQNKRIFQERKFEINDRQSIKILQEFKIVIVDDIITTGGSIRAFTEFLKKQKIKVDHVVGLMGDRRFEIDQKIEDKLKKLLKEKNIGITFESINYLTRTEAGGLIRLLNSVRSDNAIQKFAEQLQGISRFGIATNFERTPGIRHNSPGRKNIGNGRTGERLQNYTSTSSEQGSAWEIEFYRNGKPIKKDIIILSSSLNKNELRKRLKNISCQIVEANNLGTVQVKFTRIKGIKLKLQKEKKLDIER